MFLGVLFLFSCNEYLNDVTMSSSSGHFYVEDTLTCLADLDNDADDLPDTYAYKWKIKDGNDWYPIMDETSPTLKLYEHYSLGYTVDNTVKYEEIEPELKLKCEITVTWQESGEEKSKTMDSATETLQADPAMEQLSELEGDEAEEFVEDYFPVWIESVYITWPSDGDNPLSTDNLTCHVLAGHQDSYELDESDFSFEWTQITNSGSSGGEHSTNENMVSGEDTEDGQIWQCRASIYYTVEDGETSSTGDVSELITIGTEE